MRPVEYSVDKLVEDLLFAEEQTAESRNWWHDMIMVRARQELSQEDYWIILEDNP